MNFMKPNRATIRYTNSQWLPEDATETSVGGVAVPKTGREPDHNPGNGTDSLPFGTRPCPEVLQLRVPVPKCR